MKKTYANMTFISAAHTRIIEIVPFTVESILSISCIFKYKNTKYFKCFFLSNIYNKTKSYNGRHLNCHND